jgi:predicted transcriptional regulator
MKNDAQNKDSLQTIKAAQRGKKVSPRTKAVKASTIRLKPELQSALDAISEHLNRPKNKIVNEAVAEFLEKTTIRMHNDIEETLQNLHKYRAQDPSFEDAIEGFAVAESTCANEDAHEGKAYPASGQTLSHEIQDLLHA